MKDRPPSPPDLDSTRESRGLADVVRARVRAANAAKVERSSRSGEARQAALRLSQLLVTSDVDLEAFRLTRKLQVSSDDLKRARAILDRVNEALLADAGTAGQMLARLATGLEAEAEPATSSGRPASARAASSRAPSVEVITAPPVAPPVPVELAWSASQVEATIQAVAATARAPDLHAAKGGWASLGDEETALGGSSDEAVTQFFKRPAPAAGQPGTSSSVAELTIEQHAALSAECDAYPHLRAQIEQRYGIAGSAARDAVDQSWHLRLKSDDALWSHWHELYSARRGSGG